MPAPSTVISTLFRFGSLSSLSLAAEHCRRRPLRWRMESGTPSLVSTSQASVRSRLSPPSSRCLPTAVRVKLTRSPSRETRIRLKSLVPPPTSQTSTIWPSNSFLRDCARLLAIQE